MDLTRLLERWDVSAVVRVEVSESLPPPLLYPIAQGVVRVALRGTSAGETLRWIDPLRIARAFSGSEILCVFRRVAGTPPLALREAFAASALEEPEDLPRPLTAWVESQLRPVPCAFCRAGVRILNPAGIAWDSLQPFVFCGRHVPSRGAVVAETIRGAQRWGSGRPSAPGARAAVDLVMARRGVVPVPGAVCLAWELDADGKRTPVPWGRAIRFVDDRGEPVTRTRRCPKCATLYKSIQALGLCPGCGARHLADIPEFLD